MHDADDLKLARACAAKMLENDHATKALGIEIGIDAPGRASAQMIVTQSMVNGHEICHGGYIFTLADTAFAFACNAYGQVAVAASATIEFLRPATLGETLHASAEEVHRGRRSGVYDVSVVNEDQRLVATFRGRSATLKERLVDLP